MTTWRGGEEDGSNLGLEASFDITQSSCQITIEAGVGHEI